MTINCCQYVASLMYCIMTFRTFLRYWRLFSDFSKLFSRFSTNKVGDFRVTFIFNQYHWSKLFISAKPTYVIALGSKDNNHEQVNEFKLKKLISPTFMYCKATNSNIPDVVKILAISTDRPEQCALNSMLGHGGITSRWWHFSAYVNQMKLRSFQQCFLEQVMSASE